MRNYFLLLIILGIISGCATVDPDVFRRYDGAHQGIIFRPYDIPEFSGIIPEEFPYKSLGRVEGRSEKQSMIGQVIAKKGVVVRMIEAKMDCIEKAKALGANAIIDVHFPDGKITDDYLTIGEAVVFERVPTKEEVKAYQLKHRQENSTE